MHNLKVGDRFVSYMGAGEVTVIAVNSNGIVIHRLNQNDLLNIPNINVIENLKHKYWIPIQSNNLQYTEEL